MSTLTLYNKLGSAREENPGKSKGEYCAQQMKSDSVMQYLV